MKTAKVMRLMKIHKQVIFYQREERVGGEVFRRGPQWVSDGAATYCLDGLPEIRTEEQFFTAYDVKESQKEKYLFKFEDMPEYISAVERWNDRRAIPQELTVCFGRYQIKAFTCEGTGEMVMIQSKYLSPFEGEDDEFLEYAVTKTKDGIRCLCVFDGMDLKAVIAEMWFPNADKMGDTMYQEINAFNYELFSQLNHQRESVEVPVHTDQTEQMEMEEE